MINEDKLLLRYKRFIYYYINNGFNATQAYMSSYKPKNSNVAGVEGHRMLSKPKCLKVLCDELDKAGLDINEQFIIQKVLEIINNPKAKKGDILRALELISRIKGYMKPDSTRFVAVFTGLEAKEQAIVKSRLTQVDA